MVALGQAIVVEDHGVENLSGRRRGQIGRRRRGGGGAGGFGREGVEDRLDRRRGHEPAGRALRLQRAGQGQAAHDMAAADLRPGVDDEKDAGAAHGRSVASRRIKPSP
jgi:hypothetical protein